MARPHIDYLQSQTLPWQASRWEHLPGCQIKVLSRDPDDGAMSLLVRYPSGWATKQAGSLATAEELLVLEGTLELDGRRFDPDGYGWFPAGYRRTVRAAPAGAVALVFYEAEPVWTTGDSSDGHAMAEPIRLDAFELPWATEAIDPAFGGAGHRWKLLRGSPESASATMLVTCPAHLHPARWLGPQEIHTCAEEVFVLSGDLLSHIGQMCSGAYCWRPARVAHGPYGSRGGNLVLVRTHGAPLRTEITAHDLDLPRAPEYRPLLPPELWACEIHPWRPQRY